MRRGHQISGREALPLALVIGGGIGLQLAPRRPVAGVAAQGPLVAVVDRGHRGA